ncbi:MAG: 2Fe-2S iron-sulfur cluster-binding protein, partial [Defluviitaleaceae bacterium]|nr:2Fe-2S iron-sulfur cluster-binding protein [Defluviitaleaceae bacterium]
MAKITIDGLKITLDQDMTILQAAQKLGKNVPTLCFDPRLKPGGSCRLCVVEVKGNDKLQLSCAVKATDGMEICTSSDKVKAERKA